MLLEWDGWLKQDVTWLVTLKQKHFANSEALAAYCYYMSTFLTGVIVILYICLSRYLQHTERNSLFFLRKKKLILQVLLYFYEYGLVMIYIILFFSLHNYLFKYFLLTHILKFSKAYLPHVMFKSAMWRSLRLKIAILNPSWRFYSSLNTDLRFEFGRKKCCLHKNVFKSRAPPYRN